MPPDLCGAHIGIALVICFMPNPDTTQGEAEATARLAKEYGWQSIALLTTPDQTWRAELRFRRLLQRSNLRRHDPAPLEIVARS